MSERSSLQLLEERAIHQTLRAAVNRAHGDYGSALFNIGVTGKQKDCQRYLFMMVLFTFVTLDNDHAKMKTSS